MVVDEHYSLRRLMRADACGLGQFSRQVPPPSSSVHVPSRTYLRYLLTEQRHALATTDGRGEQPPPASPLIARRGV